MSRIGLHNLHYAILTKDDKTGATYSAPVRIADAVAAKVAPKSDTAKQYGDNKLKRTARKLSEVEVEIETNDLPLEVVAALLGHQIENGVVKDNVNDIAPEIALGFSSPKSNGEERFTWLLKGSFEVPEDESKSSEDKVEFTNTKLKGIFMARDFDGEWRFRGDTDLEDFTQAMADAWFTAVVDPATLGEPVAP